VKVILATAYFRYLLTKFTFDNKINGTPRIPLAIVMPIILPTPNKIKKEIITSNPFMVDAISATRLPLPAIPWIQPIR